VKIVVYSLSNYTNLKISHVDQLVNQLRPKMNRLVDLYNTEEFLKTDPLQVPKSFHLKQDQEVAAFFTATLAWGLRKTIINKSFLLMELMDNSPYEFITQHQEEDLKPFLAFKHRTFNTTDLLYFIDFLKRHYQQHDSLESAFIDQDSDGVRPLKDGLIKFHEYFFDDPNAPQRTRKHVATPKRKSACKRLNMMMRWMVRKDDRGIDLGIWHNIGMQNLYIPVDVHVDRIARSWGILTRKQVDWLAAEEVTSFCRQLDPEDPGKYDFAMFGYALDQK